MDNEQYSNIKRFVFASERKYTIKPEPKEQPESQTSEERIIAAIKKNKELHQKIDTLERKFDVLAESLAEALALLKVQVRQDRKASECHFPIKSREELEEINGAINEEHIDLYTTKLKNILGTGQSLAKCLKNVLDEELLMEYNLDGTSGKSSLKNLKNFYRALEMAVQLKIPNEPAEKTIRKAIHNIKNGAFQKLSRAI
ncbi:uncharacterized protein LOC111082024 isoform X2 [Drosophila obscura]|uniref:uncharacterized protein LOC111082024 isoform X2 n=1 Tax=Drosophila obscura TaxID=7282 RepID=UPI001BB2582B|nr:uncharacterized protein LOC111082024 isoform X2 [Drosophila obscura]